METKFQTSFIPKKPVMAERGVSSSISLFLLLSIIIFLVSLGLGVWVFTQKNLLIKKIVTAEETIKSNRNSFELDTIESMIRLDSRIKIADKLLTNHISIYPIFSLLEGRTLKSVRFKTFSFSGSTKNEEGKPSMKVTMAGQARDYKTVVLQAEEFGNVKLRDKITNPVLSDLSLTQDGSVSFSASMSVLPDFLSYSAGLVDKK